VEFGPTRHPLHAGQEALIHWPWPVPVLDRDAFYDRGYERWLVARIRAGRSPSPGVFDVNSLYLGTGREADSPRFGRVSPWDMGGRKTPAQVERHGSRRTEYLKERLREEAEYHRRRQLKAAEQLQRDAEWIAAGREPV